jgi:hypothetical protein
LHEATVVGHQEHNQTSVIGWEDSRGAGSWKSRYNGNKCHSPSKKTCCPRGEKGKNKRVLLCSAWRQKQRIPLNRRNRLNPSSIYQRTPILLRGVHLRH